MWCSIPFPGHFTAGFTAPVTFPTLWSLLNTSTRDVETPFRYMMASQQTSHNIPRCYLLTHMLTGSVTELYHIFGLFLSAELYWLLSNRVSLSFYFLSFIIVLYTSCLGRDHKHTGLDFSCNCQAWFCNLLLLALGQDFPLWSLCQRVWGYQLIIRRKYNQILYIQGACFTRVVLGGLFPLAVLDVSVVSWIIVISKTTVANNSQSTLSIWHMDVWYWKK